MTELQLMRDAGYPLPPRTRPAGETPCPALTREGLCAVYELRPTVCRVWGVTIDLPCPYGCVPERWLTRAEALEIMALANDIGGAPVGMEGFTAATVRAMLRDPAFDELARAFFAAGRETDQRAAVTPPHWPPPTSPTEGTPPAR